MKKNLKSEEFKLISIIYRDTYGKTNFSTEKRTGRSWF